MGVFKAANKSGGKPPSADSADEAAFRHAWRARFAWMPADLIEKAVEIEWQRARSGDPGEWMGFPDSMLANRR